jgi:hypothetical protein
VWVDAGVPLVFAWSLCVLVPTIGNTWIAIGVHALMISLAYVLILPGVLGGCRGSALSRFGAWMPRMARPSVPWSRDKSDSHTQPQRCGWHRSGKGDRADLLMRIC